MGTPWKDRPQAVRDENNARKRLRRSTDPEWKAHDLAYSVRWRIRTNTREAVILAIAQGRLTNTQIMAKFEIDYEDLQLIKNGKLPRDPEGRKSPNR